MQKLYRLYIWLYASGVFGGGGGADSDDFLSSPRPLLCNQ